MIYLDLITAEKTKVKLGLVAYHLACELHVTTITSPEPNLTSTRREVAVTPDTDICLVVRPYEATKESHAIHPKHF